MPGCKSLCPQSPRASRPTPPFSHGAYCIAAFLECSNYRLINRTLFIITHKPKRGFHLYKSEILLNKCTQQLSRSLHIYIYIYIYIYVYVCIYVCICMYRASSKPKMWLTVTVFQAEHGGHLRGDCVSRRHPRLPVPHLDIHEVSSHKQALSAHVQ
jgi:hypothetical protein